MTTPAERRLLRMASTTPVAARGGCVSEALDGPSGFGGANILNWEWAEQDKGTVLGGQPRRVQSVRLLAGPRVHSTRITDGDLNEDGRLVEGDLYDVVRTIRRVEGDSGGTRTRTDVAAAARTGPTGLAAIRGRALLDTRLGLGRLDGFLVAGGYPRTEFAEDGQQGAVPVAADAHGGRFTDYPTRADGLSMPIRFDQGAPSPSGPQAGALTAPKVFDVVDTGGNTVLPSTHAPTGEFQIQQDGRTIRTTSSRDQALTLARGMSALGAQLQTVLDQLTPLANAEASAKESGTPLDPAIAQQAAFLRAQAQGLKASLGALGADVSGVSIGLDSGDALTGVVDATAKPGDPDIVELWGSMDPMDIVKLEALDEALRGTNPDLYQAIARWAPHFFVSLSKLIGKPEDGDPPPEKKKDPKDPPPGGGGGGGEKDEDDDKPDPQEERIRNSFAAPGNSPTGHAIAVPESDQPVTEGIDDGDGNTVSAEKEGINRIDGEAQDAQDAGTDKATGTGITTKNDGKHLKIYKDGRLIEVQQLNGGILTGSPIPGQEQIVGQPPPPTECPIGGRRKPNIVIVDDGRFIHTYVDGVLVSSVRKEGGVLTPTNADGQGDEIKPPEGGNGEVTDGRITKTFVNGKVTKVTKNSGGILSPTAAQAAAAGLNAAAAAAAAALGGLQ